MSFQAGKETDIIDFGVKKKKKKAFPFSLYFAMKETGTYIRRKFL